MGDRQGGQGAPNPFFFHENPSHTAVQSVHDPGVGRPRQAALDPPCECPMATLAPHPQSRCKGSDNFTQTATQQQVMPSFLDDQEAPPHCVPWGAGGTTASAEPNRQLAGKEGTLAAGVAASPQVQADGQAPRATGQRWKPLSIFNRSRPCDRPSSGVSLHQASRGTGNTSLVGTQACAVAEQGWAPPLAVDVEEARHRVMVAQLQREVAWCMIAAVFGLLVCLIKLKQTSVLNSGDGGLELLVVIFCLLSYFLLTAIKFAFNPLTGERIGLVSCWNPGVSICSKGDCLSTICCWGPLSGLPRFTTAQAAHTHALPSALSDLPCNCVWARASPHRRSRCAQIRASGSLAVSRGTVLGQSSVASVGIRAGGARCYQKEGAVPKTAATPALPCADPSPAPNSLFSRDPPCTCVWARASPHRRSQCANVRAGASLAVGSGLRGPRAGASVRMGAGGGGRQPVVTQAPPSWTSLSPHFLPARDPPCTCVWARASPHRRSQCANVRAGGSLSVGSGSAGGARAGASVGVGAGGSSGAGARPRVGVGVGVGLRGGRLKPRLGLGLRMNV